VVHRDVKPANIYLCRRALEHDVVKILDFGLAKRLASGTGPEAARLTRAELVAGTPAYLAPEVALGEGVVDG
jgi:serine/threonine-protein kinase